MESTLSGAQNIDWVAVDMLVPSASNARTHSVVQVEKIANSIAQFGFNAPVLIDGACEIIAGHGRILAAIRLGLEQVPAIKLSHLSDDEIRAYRIADNRLAELGDWDMEALARELDEIRVSELDFDFDELAFDWKDLPSVFSDDALEKPLAADGYVDFEEDELPELEDKPTSRLGDIWQLGAHRLICGDCTDPSVMDALMQGGLAGLLFTDPPYGVSYKSKKSGGIANDGRRGMELERMIVGAVQSALSQMRDDASVYVCFPWKRQRQFESALQRCGLTPDSCIVWDKQCVGLGAQDYRPQHEFIFFCGRGQWHGNRAQSDVWSMRRENVNAYVHPTQKPVWLVERAIRNSSVIGDVVLDIFAGSGSTLIAAERLGRPSCSVELDPRYVDVIVKRWQNFTSQAAILEKTGSSFGRIKQERML